MCRVGLLLLALLHPVVLAAQEPLGPGPALAYGQDSIGLKEAERRPVPGQGSAVLAGVAPGRVPRHRLGLSLGL